MGNLCSIFHSRFKNLIKVISSARKAQLVDYILLGWQTSSYRLKGSNNKWFMKAYDQIVEDTSIPRSTLERYIRELADEGYIERKQALYSRTSEDGIFTVKKGTYINITEKLLVLLQSSSTQPVEKSHARTARQQDNTGIDSRPETAAKESKEPDCTDSNNNEGTDPLIMRGLYISDLYSSSVKNTINFKKMTLSVDKTTLERFIWQYETVQNFLASRVREEIPDEIKKLILGTFHNLTFEHQKFLTSPEQMAAEYLYALVNVDFYMPKVQCFRHRNNILARLVRTGCWKTPKGFYRHFYLGADFREKGEIRENLWSRKKEREISQASAFDFSKLMEQKDERLVHIEEEMHEKNCLIEKLTEILLRQDTEEGILQYRENIREVRSELEKLWDRQADLEREGRSDRGRLCA